MELWRISDVFTTSGEVRVQWVTGRWTQHIREDIGYEDEDEKSKAAASCIQAIEEALSVAELTKCGDFYREAIRIGTVAIVRSEDEELLYELVQVISMQGHNDRDDDVTVEVLDPLKMVSEDAMMAEVLGDTSDRRWESPIHHQMWVTMSQST